MDREEAAACWLVLSHLVSSNADVTDGYFSRGLTFATIAIHVCPSEGILKNGSRSTPKRASVDVLQIDREEAEEEGVLGVPSRVCEL